MLKYGFYIKHYMQCGHGDNIWFKERSQGNYILIGDASDGEIAGLCGPCHTIYYDGSFGERSRFGRNLRFGGNILWAKNPKVISPEESLDVRCAEWRSRYPLINGAVDAENGKLWARQFHKIAWKGSLND